MTLRGTPAQVSLLDAVTSRWCGPSGSRPTPATTGSPLTGRSSYVAVENPGGLAIVDNETGAVVSELAYPVGNRPHGVFLSPRRWGCSAITLGSSGWRSALPVLTVAPDSHVVGRRSSSAMPFNETSAPLAEVSNSGPLL